MSKVKFNLKKPSSDKETLIILKMYLGEKLPMVISTEEKTHAKKWDFQKQRITGRHTKIKKQNQYLDDLEEIALDEFRAFRKKGITTTNKALKNAILQKLGKQTENQFFEYIEKLYKRKTANGEKVRSYLSSSKLLKAYNPKLTFEDITITFYHEYIQHLHEKSYATNYIGVQIKNIKVFMNEAAKEKPPLHQNFDFKRNDFKKPTAATFGVFLTPMDIQKIHIAKVPKHLEVDKDFFVLACDTGLRFQNWNDINTANVREIKGEKILYVLTDKSDTNVAVPLYNRALSILDKYNGKLPKCKSNKEVNENIKEIARLAGLTRDTKKIIQRREKDVSHQPFYKLITTHSARRTFINNLKTQGVQDSDIQKMTGHSKSDTLATYDKESVIQNALKIKKKVIINSYISKAE